MKRILHAGIVIAATLLASKVAALEINAVSAFPSSLGTAVDEGGMEAAG